jgi:8-oxo-dGTP pyrophosphatase MutT (NUDIX family)
MVTGIVGRVPKVRERFGINLERFERRALDPTGLRVAAVAVTLCTAHGVPSFVLTRRASKMRRHAGQWALPGGREDEGETAQDTARRELLEEVGLAVAPDAVLGLLDDYVTRSGFVITPVVVWAGAAREIRPNPSEVQSIHRIPIDEFLRADAPMLSASHDPARPVLRMPVGQTWIAAPTAAVLYQFRELCIEGRATRVAHFEQPEFAWK